MPRLFHGHFNFNSRNRAPEVVIVKICVKLYSCFKKYSPDGTDKFFMELPEKSTVGHLVKKLDVPGETGCRILVNGQFSKLGDVLGHGDTITFFPLISGG